MKTFLIFILLVLAIQVSADSNLNPATQDKTPKKELDVALTNPKPEPRKELYQYKHCAKDSECEPGTLCRDKKLYNQIGVCK